MRRGEGWLAEAVDSGSVSTREPMRSAASRWRASPWPSPPLRGEGWWRIGYRDPTFSGPLGFGFARRG